VQFLGISFVCLLSNNPRKTRALLRYDIEIVAEIPCEASPTPYTSAYFRTKRERVGHKLSLGAYDSIGEMPAPRF
jgi:3,4-dihydroxy 2-butanone 4-phosphate synthase/GTP cyclohydrolase II